MESFLNHEAEACNFAASLVCQLDDALGGVASRQEVVDYQNAVVGLEKFLTCADGDINVFGEGVHHGRKHVLHRGWFLLLDKHHWAVSGYAHGYGWCYAAGFDSHNLIVITVFEALGKLFADSHHQVGIHLMVDKTIHFQYATVEALALAKNTVFE